MKIKRIASESEMLQKKVAAYARVSTEKEEQESSYETQVEYYTDYIKRRRSWEFAGIYSDHGISGVSAEKRPGFMKMVEDAQMGKIQLILVRSISRFARNASEAQKYVKLLKDCKTEIRFEREGISSFDPASDMAFNMLAAVAQEESRAASERIKWANERRAEQGIHRIGSGRMLGYDEVGGILTPNKDAWIVKLIFEMYANGSTLTGIIECLNEKNVVGIRSGRPLRPCTLHKMLRNVIYVGDRELQKQAHCNFLTKKPDNQPFVTRYFQNTHEGIIDRETWERVRARTGKKVRG